MKTPVEVSFYPLDKKKDEDSKGIWFYLPEWIVRAYGLRSSGTNMGKIKFVIKRDKRPMIEYGCEEDCLREYYRRNWARKILREERRARNGVKKNG